jgi:hypothetical protein
VLHVAFGKLARGAAHDLRAQQVGRAQASAMASCNWSRKPVAPPAW